jgi:MFS family permease
MMIFLLPATGLLLPLRLQSLQLSALWFGACGAALSLGLLAGVAGLADALIQRLDRVRAIGAALALCGLAIGLIGVCDRALGLLALFALIGLCMSVTQLVGQTHRTLAVPENFRARMTAGQLTISQLAGMLAPALAGLLLLRSPVAEVYLYLAAGFLASGLLLLLIPELRPFLRLDHEQVKNWYGHRYPEAFEPAQNRFKARKSCPDS